MKIIVALVVGLALYTIMRVLNRMRQQSIQNIWIGGFLKALPIIEFSSWTGFIFWIIAEFFYDQVYYVYLLVVLIGVLVVLLAWFLGRDYIAGTIIKAQNVYKVGQPVTIENQHGTIKKIGNLHLTIRTDRGDDAHIPYSSLTNKTIIQERSNDISVQVMRLELPDSLSADEWVRKIRKTLVINPYVFSGSDSVITITPKESGFLAEVHASTLNDEHALHVEKQLARLSGN
ncbi:MAG: mechanosensitive ion channel [Flammeovirgaceae bacterium]|nr:mechanosensitive ion channel [Flammeovirgaceae bacterium]